MTTSQRSTDPIGAGDEASPVRCTTGVPRQGHRSAEAQPEGRRVAAGSPGVVSQEGGNTFRDRKTAKQVRESLPLERRQARSPLSVQRHVRGRQ